MLLSSVLIYNETASSVSKCFTIVKDELSKFTEGEMNNGQNLKGFALLEVAKSVVYPLFPIDNRKVVEEQVKELLSDIGFETSYFISLKDILGNDDPLVLSLLSGDRLIAIFDPNDTEFDLLSSDPMIPTLASYEFIITDPLSKEFIEDVSKASESGKILVIHHSDSVLHNQFLNSIASAAVKSSTFQDHFINIDSDFRVIFLLDRPPHNLNPHVTFIYCPNFEKAKLESLLMNDDAPIQTQQKRLNAEMMLQAQRENLYVSLQHLNNQLQKIHASDNDVLKDVLLQAQLLQTSIQATNNSNIMSEHVMDGFEWVEPIADKIISFVNKLQNLYKISPLYLWSFSKVKEMIDDLKGKKEELIPILYQRVASTMLESHHWGVDELKNAKKNIKSENCDANQYFYSTATTSKMNILHYTDIAFAAEFFLKDDNKFSTVNFSVEKDTILKGEEIMEILLNKEEGIDVVITFFEENEETAKLIDRIATENPPEMWNENTKIFVLTDNSFEMPAHMILTFRLIALE